MTKSLLGLTLVLALAPASTAAITLPAVLGDGMVLQRDREVPVWGRANPGERVTVRFAGQRKSATADGDGRWIVRLDPLRASAKPREMRIESSRGEPVVLGDVLVGEVWLCSGQSNMAWPLKRARDGAAEAQAAEHPRLRLFTVARRTAAEPLPDVVGTWAPCSPRTAASFSAVAYFFGREIHRELEVPVGLIHSSWGGTPAEAWTSRRALEAESALKPLLDRWGKTLAGWDPEKAKAEHAQRIDAWQEAVSRAKAAGKPAPRRPRPPADPTRSPHRPANLWNGMIAPLLPVAIRGVIWYQGESNATRPQEYRTLFPAMIRDWRRAWSSEDLPFLFVQLANFKARSEAPGDSAWAELRDAQLATLRSVPATGMAVIIDIGEARDIHPKNKQDVGRRLALWALAKTYGREVVPSGPLYREHERRGREIVLRFDHAEGGLLSAGDGPLRGFGIAGRDGRFVWANARIEGETVVVSHPEVADPAAVRYAWADNPEAPLTNRAGLPASPFRTE